MNMEDFRKLAKKYDIPDYGGDENIIYNIPYLVNRENVFPAEMGIVKILGQYCAKTDFECMDGKFAIRQIRFNLSTEKLEIRLNNEDIISLTEYYYDYNKGLICSLDYEKIGEKTFPEIVFE